MPLHSEEIKLCLKPTSGGGDCITAGVTERLVAFGGQRYLGGCLTPMSREETHPGACAVTPSATQQMAASKLLSLLF